MTRATTAAAVLFAMTVGYAGGELAARLRWEAAAIKAGAAEYDHRTGEFRWRSQFPFNDNQ